MERAITFTSMLGKFRSVPAIACAAGFLLASCAGAAPNTDSDAASGATGAAVQTGGTTRAATGTGFADLLARAEAGDADAQYKAGTANF